MVRRESLRFFRNWMRFRKPAFRGRTAFSTKLLGPRFRGFSFLRVISQHSCPKIVKPCSTIVTHEIFTKRIIPGLSQLSQLGNLIQSTLFTHYTTLRRFAESRTRFPRFLLGYPWCTPVLGRFVTKYTVEMSGFSPQILKISTKFRFPGRESCDSAGMARLVDRTDTDELGRASELPRRSQDPPPPDSAPPDRPQCTERSQNRFQTSLE